MVKVDESDASSESEENKLYSKNLPREKMKN